MSFQGSGVTAVTASGRSVVTGINEQSQSSNDRNGCYDHEVIGLAKKRISMREIAAQMRADESEIPLSDSISRHEFISQNECVYSPDLENQVVTTRYSRNTEQEQYVKDRTLVVTPVDTAVTAVTGRDTDYEEWPAGGEPQRSDPVDQVGTSRNSPEEWIAGAARLRSALPLEGFSNHDWLRLLNDTEYLAGPRAGAFADHGWTTLDLFGAHPDVPAAGLHLAGLALVLRGFEVTEVTDQHARMKAPSGSVLTYRRRNLRGSVPVWSVACNVSEETGL